MAAIPDVMSGSETVPQKIYSLLLTLKVKRAMVKWWGKSPPLPE